MWATDAYAHLGKDYERNEEIQEHLITGANIDIIKTRARKEFEQQSSRTRKRAEVFTPLWICRFMNDKLDEEWFGYPNVFFKEDKPVSKVRFFEKKRRRFDAFENVEIRQLPRFGNRRQSLNLAAPFDEEYRNIGTTLAEFPRDSKEEIQPLLHCRGNDFIIAPTVEFFSNSRFNSPLFGGLPW